MSECASSASLISSRWDSLRSRQFTRSTRPWAAVALALSSRFMGSVRRLILGLIWRRRSRRKYDVSNDHRTSRGMSTSGQPASGRGWPRSRRLLRATWPVSRPLIDANTRCYYYCLPISWRAIIIGNCRCLRTASAATPQSSRRDALRPCHSFANSLRCVHHVNFKLHHTPRTQASILLSRGQHAAR